jgi:hypothetical protein
MRDEPIKARAARAAGSRIQVGESKNMESTGAFVLSDRRRVATTEVFDTFWKFAALRQQIFLRRIAGLPSPWTTDPILRNHRFTNVFRASDRVSQFLIRRVLYTGEQTPREVFFRAILFKLFNKIETWLHLETLLGELTWKTFDLELYGKVLDTRAAAGKTIYSAAYIMPPPPFAGERKHRKHLALLESMLRDGAAEKVAKSDSLQHVYETLLGYPSLGPFLAFQFAIDLNYSSIIDFSEMDFVVAGPGAKNGIKKCFPASLRQDEETIIRAVTESASEQFAARGLSFSGLWGRPLQLIDVQNLFCEVDKYARVAHPTAVGTAARSRIKQRYNPNFEAQSQWYPPKWKLTAPPAAATATPPAKTDIRSHEQGALNFRL